MNKLKLAGGAIMLFLSVFVLTQPAKAAVSYDLSPTSAEIKAGESIQFNVIKTSAEIETNVTDLAKFDENDPIGNMTSNKYNAGQAGNWTITVKIDDQVLKAKISVSVGEAARIKISPSAETTDITIGQTQQYEAEAFDKFNNKLDSDQIKWSGAYSLGTIDDNGLFTAQRPGSSQIIATADQIIAVAPITVVRIIPVEGENTNGQDSADTNTNEESAIETDVTEESAEQSEVLATSEETKIDSNCSSMPWWAWLLSSIGFLAIIHIYHYFIRKNKANNLLIVTLVAVVAAVWLYYAFRCGGEYPWVVWLIIIGSLVITLLRPRSFEAQYGEDL
ncbi:hypothetical protein ACFL04_01690 [Patescibacteria group bacterium]